MIKFNNQIYNNEFKKFLYKNYNKISFVGNSKFTTLAEKKLQNIYKGSKVLLTTSCTHALEMSALLTNISKNDEVLIPSYTFPSTVNAFLLRGAKITFVDSSSVSPNLCSKDLEKKISYRSKCVVLVHYGGALIDIEHILFLKRKYNFLLIEDAAQSIGSYYKNKPLGTFGEMGCISFHDTKNLSMGEGGALIINKKEYYKRSEIIREKGTNRKDFINGKVNKYEWVDIGSSYIPSDLLALLLCYQLKKIKFLNNKRKLIFNSYFNAFIKFNSLKKIQLPKIEKLNYHNAHIFFIVFSKKKTADNFIDYMWRNKIEVFRHYRSLHNSKFVKKSNLIKTSICKNSDHYSKCLVRLPLNNLLKKNDINKIIKHTQKFLNNIF